MLNRLPDSELDRFFEEDCPYGDLTTHLLGIGRQKGRITFFTREETVLCGTEEAGRLLERCGARVGRMEESGTRLSAGVEFLVADGEAGSLHAGWKLALNLLEYASGIATRTARIIAAARAVNPAVVVTTTRKSFPGTRKISIKAITAAGAVPHRLGLSETILVFRQHTAFLGGLEPFLGMIGDLRKRAPETAIMVEAESTADAVAVAAAGPDVLQIDKVAPADLSALVPQLRKLAPMTRISAAGGINESNAAVYAATGVDILVLSSAYFGRPADIGVRLEPVV
ncbi:ModD protein [Geobacter sulfurreducens]|uniref:ModD protein n=1 Tax=Geobacter sulfurreducens TaxID=35554 RepID=UPI000DBB1748|nr:ModD protein [Geobacter sulfurreducens]BBA71364.1 Nicotinate-nucleotide pyrophosphorylase [carboxylating] [Geobacter sulfurreducens]